MSPLNLTFDPIVTIVTTTLSLTCTAQTGAIITLGQGSNIGRGSREAAPTGRASYISGGTRSYLNYNLHKPNGTTLGRNTTGALPTVAEGSGVAYIGTGSVDTSFLIYSVAPKEHTTVPAGAYPDTVVATIFF